MCANVTVKPLLPGDIETVVPGGVKYKRTGFFFCFLHLFYFYFLFF